MRIFEITFELDSPQESFEVECNVDARATDEMSVRTVGFTDRKIE